MKVGNLIVLSNHSTFHLWSAQSTALLLLPDELLRCCKAGNNVCLDLRRRAFPLCGQVSTDWSRCPSSRITHSSDSVAPLRRTSSCEMPARIASGMPARIVRWCRTQASSHNSQGAVEGKANEAGVRTAAPDRCAILCRWMEPWLRWIFAALFLQQSSPRQQAASRVRRVMSNFAKWLDLLAICEGPVQRYSQVFVLGAKGRVSLLWLALTLV